MSASGLCYVNHHLCLSPQEEQEIQPASCFHLVDSHPDQQQKMVLCWGLDLLQHQQLGDLDLQVVQVQCLDLQAVQVLGLGLRVGEAAVNSPSASSQLLRLLPPLHHFPLLSHLLFQQVGAAL